MQNLERTTVQYETYTLGNKLVYFDTNLSFELYQNKWYYGIIFTIQGDGDGVLSKDARYDIVHHYHMDWERLIINNKEGWKDMPFHKGTYRFLPDGIRILEL